ncbi:MAG TPA: hypothetical protein VM597_28700 [Gemmataceae bacterium]|jgi:hypothetical protein|nr:hypothetical protein [Gemmataceae bacterium]
MTPKSAAYLAATLAFLVGCGGPPAKKMVTVTGTVSYKGELLTSGVIKFLAPNGDFAAAAIPPDGKFVMSEVVPGEQKVAYVGGPVNVGSSGGAADGNEPKRQAVAVPAKFGEPQTSGVTVTVSENGGDVAIELK